MKTVTVELTESEIMELVKFLEENTCEGDNEEIDRAYVKLKGAV